MRRTSRKFTFRNTQRGSAQNHAVTIEKAANHNKPQQRPCYEPQHLVFFMGGEQRAGVDFTALSRPSFSNANSGRQKNRKQLSSSPGVVKKSIKPWLE